MKRRSIRVLGAALCLSAVASVQAAPCITAGLADYLALGPGGCSVGSLGFSDFALPGLLGAAAPIDPASVSVAPLSGPSGTGLSLMTTQAAGAGDFLQLRLGFNVTPASGRINRARIDLIGAQASGDGVTTLLEDLCLGADFGDPTNLICGTSTATLVTLAIDGAAMLTDALDLLPAEASLGVVADLGVDGGLQGSATFTAGNLLFNVVPAPSSTALLALGALGLAALRRRPHPC